MYPFLTAPAPSSPLWSLLGCPQGPLSWENVIDRLGLRSSLSSVTSGKLLNLSRPQFSHMYNGSIATVK